MVISLEAFVPIESGLARSRVQSVFSRNYANAVTLISTHMHSLQIVLAFLFDIHFTHILLINSLAFYLQYILASSVLFLHSLF